MGRILNRWVAGQLCKGRIELLRASGRRLDEAERLFRAARGLQEELVAEVSSDPAYRLELARSCYNLGILTMDTGRPTEAEQDYDRAVELLQKLTEEFPRVPDYRHALQDPTTCQFQSPLER